MPTAKFSNKQTEKRNSDESIEHLARKENLSVSYERVSVRAVNQPQHTTERNNTHTHTVRESEGERHSSNHRVKAK